MKGNDGKVAAFAQVGGQDRLLTLIVAVALSSKKPVTLSCMLAAKLSNDKTRSIWIPIRFQIGKEVFRLKPSQSPGCAKPPTGLTVANLSDGIHVCRC